MSVLEINVQDLVELLKSDKDFILLDVREPWEVAQAAWDDARLRFAPMSQLAQVGIAPLEKEVPNTRWRVSPFSTLFT